MKLQINTPIGNILLELEPMGSGEFYALLAVIGLALVLWFLFG